MSVPSYFSITIGYKDVYDDYNQFDVNNELKKEPSVIWLKLISHFNALMHSNIKEEKLQSGFFEAWHQLLSKASSFKLQQWQLRNKNKGIKSNLINNQTSLLFIEKIYENFNDADIGEGLTNERYETFFKCYVYISQHWLDRAQEKTLHKKEKIEQYLYLYLPLQFSMIEIIEQKDFRLQFMKGIYFFKFCETNSCYKDALKEFLQAKNVLNWQTYLINLLGPYVKTLAVQNEIPSSSLKLKDTGQLKDFFDNLCADPTTYQKLDDYKYLRNHPLFRFKEDYIFTFPNFFVDKLYQALKFDFATTLIKSGVSFKGKKINAITDFLKAYGEDFAETGLFYEVIEFCVSKKKNYISRRGEGLKKSLKEGEPDYYIRDKSKIYLFEFKDTLISHSAKGSLDYEKITQELNKKFIQNESGEPKGLTQLINSITKIINGDYKKFDIDSIDIDKVVIYPIIIFTDGTLNARGVNFYLNKKFTMLLNEIKAQLTIRPLTLIHIDSLIKYQDLFHENKISLNQCLNFYHGIIESTNVEQKVFTFESALDQITAKFKYDKTPKMFWDTIHEVMKRKDGDN